VTVFQRYKLVRKELKISQEEIAGAIGITQSALSQQAQRENVPIEALEYIRKAYNVNMNWLFSGEGEIVELPPSDELKEWIRKHDELQILVDELTKDLEQVTKDRALLRGQLKKKAS
jgi:transcriptional regulator with XRE-family HTH domain